MSLKFTSGKSEDLKNLLSTLVPIESWKETNPGTFQARLTNGGILNYYSTTGTINFQGKSELATEAEKLVEQLLERKPLAEQQITTFQEIKDSNNEEVANLEESPFLSSEFPNTEIIIGLVGAVGVEYNQVIQFLTDRLKYKFSYQVHEIRVSEDVIKKLPNYDSRSTTTKPFERINHLMDEGNKARQKSNNNAILAMGAVAKIRGIRAENTPSRTAYLINTLKHPEEVKYLREIYGSGFYLIGVFADQKDRHKYLTNDLGMDEREATDLIVRDGDESMRHGQHTSNTFDLSDFFVFIDENRLKLKSGIHRFLDIIFGHPNVTPTFEEYAMFMAFVSSLRSADLSRQVGAVVTKGTEILSSGTNDCPRAGGGLYWPIFDEDKHEIIDVDFGRDYKRGFDSNVKEKQSIIDDIIGKLPPSVDKDEIRELLENSKIKELTEYGRVVHAEMEALIACARNQISAKKSTLFCTTFPCHNCAKHIIAAGVKRVVYIEPYPKSKALEFHSESAVLGFHPKTETDTVYFEPFTGLGPRRFFDLFSMSLGSGRTIQRKTKTGDIYVEKTEELRVKNPLIPLSYLDREMRAESKFKAVRL